MNIIIIDQIWIGAMGIAAACLAVLTLVVVKREGRARIYVSLLLAAFTAHALASFLTGVTIDTCGGALFKIPRTVTWTSIAMAAASWIMYHLNIFNGKSTAGKTE